MWKIAKGDAVSRRFQTRGHRFNANAAPSLGTDRTPFTIRLVVEQALHVVGGAHRTSRDSAKKTDLPREFGTRPEEFFEREPGPPRSPNSSARGSHDNEIRPAFAALRRIDARERLQRSHLARHVVVVIDADDHVTEDDDDQQHDN